MPCKFPSKMLNQGELSVPSCIWQNGYDNVSFISVCCFIKQGNHYEFPRKCLQRLEKEFVYKHEFQNLAIMLLLDIKRYFWRISY